MSDQHEKQLVNYLSDAYSIEQQALAQLRSAPEVAGDESLASAFRQHLTETEGQAEALGELLEAHEASPSRLKDAVMALGGKSFLLFARTQPDTPGKLAAHAYSYEAFEWASYEMLIRMAERAGDDRSAATARAIRDQERAMMERLAAGFGAAADASLRDVGEEDILKHLPHYLADAHALEEQSIQLLEKGREIAGDRELERLYRDHLEESRQHVRWVEDRLEEMDASPSAVKDVALRVAAINWGLFFQAQGDTPGKLAVFAYAVEHLEIAGYELLRHVAQRAGDATTVQLADKILRQERAMADRVAGAFDGAFDATLETETPEVP